MALENGRARAPSASSMENARAERANVRSDPPPHTTILCLLKSVGARGAVILKGKASI